jgi:hypothetical protein
VSCERFAGGFICGRSRMKKSKKKKPEKPKLMLVIGRIYLVKRYYTGDFRAKCCDSLERSVRLKVTDPMSSTVAIGDELEIPFVHAEFIPAVVVEFQKPVEQPFQRSAG